MIFIICNFLCCAYFWNYVYLAKSIKTSFISLCSSTFYWNGVVFMFKLFLCVNMSHFRDYLPLLTPTWLPKSWNFKKCCQPHIIYPKIALAWYKISLKWGNSDIFAIISAVYHLLPLELGHLGQGMFLPVKKT